MTRPRLRFRRRLRAENRWCGCRSVLVNGERWPVLTCTRHLTGLIDSIVAERLAELRERNSPAGE